MDSDYLNIAEGLKSGILVNGEYQYTKYTGSNGAKEAGVVTNDTHLWRIYKDWAPYHPELENFSTFEELMGKIRREEPFHVARYNDGEWAFMLRIEPYYSKFIAAHGHNEAEIRQISDKLLQIIEKPPSYYIGIDSTTRALRGLIYPVREIFQEKIDIINNIIYGDIFNAATIRFGINCLKQPLKDRLLISVGPEYMVNLGANYHITVPENNCWVQYAFIKKLLLEKITQVLEKKPVILYSCSLLAKLLIDEVQTQYYYKVTQLDLGSCIDRS